MKQLFVVLLLSVVVNSFVVGCAGMTEDELFTKANETGDWTAYNKYLGRK